MSVYNVCKRTVQALNNGIADKGKALEENRTEIDTLEERVKTLKEQTDGYISYKDIECERTVQALNNEIADKDKALEENRTEIDTLAERVKNIEKTDW